MDERLVSVVIPSYGRDIALIRRSIDSARAQSHQPVEILLVDDNEPDSPHSEGIRAYCGQAGASYLRTKGKQGACAARNLGFENAKGDFVGFLDDDDEWMPDKVKLSLPLFSQGVGMVASRGYRITQGEQGDIQEEYMSGAYLPDPGFIDLLRRDIIGTTTNAILSRACFVGCGGFNEALPARQDYEFWLRIAKKYKIAMVEDYLFKHYIHAREQISKNANKSVAGMKIVYNEFKRDIDSDKLATVYIWRTMLSYYQQLGDRWNAFWALMRVVRAQPRFLGRFIADNTRSEKLRAFLRKRQRNALMTPQEIREAGEKQKSQSIDT